MKRDKQCEECDNMVVYLGSWQIEGSDVWQVCRRCFQTLKLMYPE
jgi:hypothetical protein